MSINKNIFYTFLSQIPVQLLGIISGIFITRIVGAEGKGTFAIYQANSLLLVSIFSLSIGNVLTYFIPENKIKIEKILGISIIVIILSSVSVIILALFFYYTRFNVYLFPIKQNDALYLIWLCLFSIVSIINMIITGFFQGLKLFKIINKVNIVSSIINLCSFGLFFILFYYKIMPVSVKMLLYVLLIVTVINSIQFLVPFYTHVNIKPNYEISYKTEVAPILNFTLITHLSLFIVFLNNRLSLWLLNYYLSETAIGLFSLVSNLIIVFSMISAPIANILLPFITSKEHSEKNPIFYLYSKLNFSILLICGVCSYFIAPYIIPIMYGAEFKDSVILFQILIPGILISCVCRIYAVYITASNKQSYNLYVTIIGFIANIVLSFYLVVHHGLIGIAIASSLTYLVIGLTYFYYIHFKLTLPFGNYLFLTKKDFKQLNNIFIKSNKTN